MFLAIGCGQKKDKGGPSITKFKFEQQFPADPYTAVFSFAFQAGDVGVGLGFAEFYVGSGDKPVKLKLGDLLAASGLPRTAKSGELGAALRFASKDIKDGAQVDMALVLVDDDEKRSNRAHVRLEFDLP
ncbi:MAG: hypothetical protein IT381_09820 [Deltaproteobacteria bacterium]|nr:hypothetical protein [Deltaproteobacteria bacterium]